MVLKKRGFNACFQAGRVFFLVLALFLSAAGLRAEEKNIPERRVNGVVRSISFDHIKISHKFSEGYYLSYIFYISAKTRFSKAVRKGDFVEVKFSKMYEKPGFVSLAEEITVLAPANDYYLKRY